MQITFNTWGRGQYIFPGLDFEAAQANDALVFWYDGDFDATICLGVEVATVDADDALYTEVDFSYVSYEDGKVSLGESGTVGVWDNGIGGWLDCERKAMLGGTGFLIVSAEDLKAAGIPSVQQVKRIRFGAPGDGQANPSPASLNGEPLKFIIDDIGHVHDVDTFVSDIKTEHEITYLVEPTEPGDVIKLEVAFEGTFADASWTEFPDAYQYFVNLYTVDGEAYTYVRTNNTRQTSATLSELLPSTVYVMQVLAMDKDEKVLSASNVMRFTTLEEDKPPYLDGPLPHDESMTIDRVIVSNGTDATVEWEWIDGVFTYTVYLYTVEDGVYTFVEKQDARFGDGSVAFTGLDKSRSYVAQVVAYDVSESIIFAYKPVEFDLSGNSNFGGSDVESKPDDGIPATGVEFPLATVALSLCAFMAIVATRKYKVQ